MSATGTCTQPGCTGTVLDGYCDVCGMPPDSAAASAPVAAAARPEPSPPPSSRAPAPAGSAASPTPTPHSSAPPSAAPRSAGASGEACGQPGCPGTILDGYCDVCGSPPGPAAVPEDRSVATSAARVGSAALGSRRLHGGSQATTRTRTGSSRLRAARLGAGLTRVPPAPPVDAASAIMQKAEVGEDKRFCSSCGAPVGRSSDGRPGRTDGFCPQCRTPYSFSAKLQPGDLVAGQYEVAGALAHGGLGWIYLARDRNVSMRWVVLKGLLNSGDQDALAAAIAEQQFLAQVEHPLIVEIYNFVTHEDAGYIVMEYVGGHSLKQVLKQRMAAAGVYDPLPVDQALAYVYEVLPAFSYLHDLGLVYCDFKPDNLIQVGDAVKLIDLGGVRRLDDEESAIYGTVGYQAPEVAEVGPSVASDVYTIGRTLLVLCMEFRGYQGTYLHSLPPAETTPLFTEYDSLHWLIAKCCATDPADRFASVDELRAQLLGVLREVVARRTTGTALTSASSVLFHTPAVSGAALGWADLPDLRPDPTDPQHAWVTSLVDDDPEQRLDDLRSPPEVTPEVELARAAAALELGRTDDARSVAQRMLQTDPWEWRALWVDGLAALQGGDLAGARAAFNAVYQQVPGELAPKLALALACESGDLGAVAEGLFTTCAQTDASYAAPAAFGIARIRAARGDATGAVEALDLVPPTSRGYPESRRLRARVLLDGAGDDVRVLAQALDSVSSVRMDAAELLRLRAEILERALASVTRHGPQPGRIGNHQISERDLRDGLEQTYRSLAREAATPDDRIALVNRANATRNWTLT